MPFAMPLRPSPLALSGRLLLHSSCLCDVAWVYGDDEASHFLRALLLGVYGLTLYLHGHDIHAGKTQVGYCSEFLSRRLDGTDAPTWHMVSPLLSGMVTVVFGQWYQVVSARLTDPISTTNTAMAPLTKLGNLLLDARCVAQGPEGLAPLKWMPHRAAAVGSAL